MGFKDDGCESKLRIVPLAFDSYGVRGMATYVKTPDCQLVLDPGAALAPSRFGLPPAPQERLALKKALARIKRYSKRADVMTISHYHYDHYLPDTNIYGGKKLYIKHPTEHINKSQMDRAKKFLRFLDRQSNKPSEIKFADAIKVRYGRTRIEFSPAVKHGGLKSKLGYVIMCAIQHNRQSLVHASDVQGPQTDKATDWIISKNPKILILSGFPILFLGWKMSKRDLEKSNLNLIRIIKKTRVETIILEHHITRKLNYTRMIEQVLRCGDEFDCRIITAAEFAGKKPMFLEPHRKEFWEEIKR